MLLFHRLPLVRSLWLEKPAIRGELVRGCGQELCPNWAGDGGCPCQVFDIDPPDIDYHYQSRDEIADYQED